MHRDIDPRDIRAGAAGRSPAAAEAADEPERARTDEPRDALTRDLDLPRGPRRERVRRRDWEGDLRGSEVRMLATAGAFRVVPMDELRRPTTGRTSHRKDVERLRGWTSSAPCPTSSDASGRRW